MSDHVSHSLVKALQGVPDLASLDEHALLAIVGASMNLFYAPGSKVFEKGNASEGLYIVLSGEVRVHDPDDPGAEEFRVGPGRSFGELSLLLERKHSKVAEAVADTELMVLPEESFRELLEHTPELAKHFQRRLEEQVQVRGETPEGDSA
jgi:CRP-like cAMP-binding protein